MTDLMAAQQEVVPMAALTPANGQVSIATWHPAPVALFTHPAPFDSTSHIDIWLDKMHMFVCSVHPGCDEDTFANSLTTSMAGIADQWVQMQLNDDMSIKLSSTEFIQHPTQEFTHFADAGHTEAELCLLKQTTAVCVYVNDFQSTTSRVPNMVDDDQCHWLLHGLSEIIYKPVKLTCLQTYNDVCQCALAEDIDFLVPIQSTVSAPCCTPAPPPHDPLAMMSTFSRHHALIEFQMVNVTACIKQAPVLNAANLATSHISVCRAMLLSSSILHPAVGTR
ncbi:hypothetical protein LPJ66_000771 [Kickxella alabastrina]|uniref:Uncharacterized protein n=1 Tax=Kickxella alabastrina TaxID=61397 RepID=A0ACC1IV48_9FUNG|nr:hypothetical protein LPJ66_000771 [Kickxella alabastrina]